MKASELRINNWYDHDGDYRQVTPKTIEEVWEAERSWCKPIPLTEEWMVRFGFKDNEYTFDLHSGRKTITFNWSSRIISTGYRSGLYCKKYRHIQYVHQLQNLYFALSGEELTFKP